MLPGPLFPSALLMLGLDPRDASSIDAVVAIAPRIGLRQLTLLHVSPLEPVPDGLSEVIKRWSTDQAAALESARAELAMRLPDVEILARDAAGDPVVHLIAVAEETAADLVVLGRGASWGPHGLAALRYAPASILVVPEGTRVDTRECVVGLDFSSHATAALAVAVRLFDSVRAVYQVDTDTAAVGELSDAEFELHLAENVAHHFEVEVLSRLPEATATPALELIVASRADRAVLAAAGRRPIVIGSRGLSRVASLILGSTAERVAGVHDGPVLVLRKGGSAMGFISGLFHR